MLFHVAEPVMGCRMGFRSRARWALQGTWFPGGLLPPSLRVLGHLTHPVEKSQGPGLVQEAAWPAGGREKLCTRVLCTCPDLTAYTRLSVGSTLRPAPPSPAQSPGQLEGEGAS